MLGEERLDPRRPKEVVSGEMHIATVDGPTEDRKILELMFHDDTRPLALRTHSQWWLHADHTVAFPYHERILRLLQSHRPPYRWLLKSPDFVHYIEPVVAQYPDVKFVMTHREPLKVVPSACSVTVAGTRLRIPHWQYPGTFGRDMLDNLATGTRHVIASPARSARTASSTSVNPSSTPIRSRWRNASTTSRDSSSRPRSAPRWSSGAWRTGPARGEHKYSPEEFGLTDDLIRTEFAEYYDHYAKYSAPVSC